MNDWIFFTPSQKYYVNTFDDGNQKYECVPNVWLLYGTWRDKVALVNQANRNVRIESISSWKTSVIDMLQ